MTKRQLFLIAGTIVLAACGTNVSGPCEFTEDTAESICWNRPTVDQSGTPAPSVDPGEPL